MTIAKKLLLLLAVSLTGLLSVGGITLWSLKSIDAQTYDINKMSLPSIRAISRAQVAAMRVRPPILMHLLVPSSEEKQANEKRFEEHMLELKEALKSYEEFIDVNFPEDRRYWENSNNMIEPYEQAVRKTFALSRKGLVSEALQNTIELRAQIQALNDNLGQHVEWNHKEVGRVSALVESGVKSTVQTVIAILCISLIVAAACGVMVYRQISHALCEMLSVVIHVEKELDFTVRANVSGKDEVARVGAAVNSLLERLQGSFKDLLGRVEAVSQIAHHVSVASGQLLGSSSQQNDAAANMAAAIEEMTVSIGHVADRAEETRQLAVQAETLSRESGERIATTVEGINSISEKVAVATEQITRLELQSEQINSVVSVIKDVAEQTNLLALNAAIEAARAGEQGRGFAVVADEVRKLAERTSQSTREIALTIQEMQSGSHAAVQSVREVVEQVSLGVESANEANTAIRQLGEGGVEAARQMSDVTDAIKEQSGATTAIAQQVELVARGSEQVNQQSHAASDIASELERVSAAMQQIVSEYKV